MDEPKIIEPEKVTEEEMRALEHGGKSGMMSNIRPLIVPLVIAVVVSFAFFSFKDPAPKTDFLASIAGINKAVDELRGTDKSSVDRINVIDTKITGTQGTVVGQQAKIDQLAGQVSDLSGKVTAAQNTAANTANQLGNYASKGSVDALSGLAGRVDAASAKADGAKTTADTANSNALAAKKDISDLKDSTTTQLADLKKQLSDLQAQISSGTTSTSTGTTVSDVSIDVTSWSGMTLDLHAGSPGSVMFNFKVTNNTNKTLSQLQLVMAIASSTSILTTPSPTMQLVNMNNALETWTRMSWSSTSSVWTNIASGWGNINTVTLAPKQSKTWLMQYTVSVPAGATPSPIIGVSFYPQIVAQNYTLN